MRGPKRWFKSGRLPLWRDGQHHPRASRWWETPWVYTVCAQMHLYCAREQSARSRKEYSFWMFAGLWGVPGELLLCADNWRGADFPAHRWLHWHHPEKGDIPLQTHRGQCWEPVTAANSFIDHWSSLIHPNGLSTHRWKPSLTGIYVSSKHTYLSCIINCVFFCFLQKQSKDRFGLEGDEESTMLEESVSPKKCVKIVALTLFQPIKMVELDSWHILNYNDLIRNR